MPLSEHEQRQLEQIEQALYREDPKFGRVVRSSDPRVHYKRKLVQALVGVLAGGGAVAAGLASPADGTHGRAVAPSSGGRPPDVAPASQPRRTLTRKDSPPRLAR